MTTNSSASIQKTETVGYLLGGLGIAIFSLTYPATKVAVPVFGSWLTTSARAAIAGSLAVIVLAFVRPQLPRRSQWRGILIVSFCVTIGFPLFIALALEELPASRTAIVTAVLPTATAVIGSVRQRQRPSWQFWAAAFAGVVTVAVFAIASSPNQRPQVADLLLLAAIGFAAVGYTEGAEVSKQIGGWQTISWAVVLALPLTVPATLLLTTTQTIPPITADAAAGLAYVAVGSNFLGFFAWYGGLRRGGVARVSQIQLLQPILTLVAAAILLGETITIAAGATAAIVVSCVLASRRSRIYPADDPSTNVDAARPRTALARSSP